MAGLPPPEWKDTSSITRVPNVVEQANIWDKIVNSLLQGEVTFVVPDHQGQPALDRKVKKTSTVLP